MILWTNLAFLCHQPNWLIKFNYNIEKFACDFAHQDKILSMCKPMKKLFCQ